MVYRLTVNSPPLQPAKSQLPLQPRIWRLPEPPYPALKCDFQQNRTSGLKIRKEHCERACTLWVRHLDRRLRSSWTPTMIARLMPLWEPDLYVVWEPELLVDSRKRNSQELTQTSCPSHLPLGEALATLPLPCPSPLRCPPDHPTNVGAVPQACPRSKLHQPRRIRWCPTWKTLDLRKSMWMPRSPPAPFLTLTSSQTIGPRMTRFLSPMLVSQAKMTMT